MKKESASFGAKIGTLLKRMSARERNQLVGAVCAVMLIFYGALVWFPANKKLGELQYKQGKLEARKKHSSSTPPPKTGMAGGYINPKQLEAELKKMQKAGEVSAAELTRITQRFISYDDLESLQTLKSGITRLAEGGDMEISVLEHIHQRKEDRERPPTADLLKDAAKGNPYNRPLLRLRARASYRGLMHFLDGLDKLAFIAAPVWVDIGVKTEQRATGRQTGGRQASQPVRQWLEVEIHLAV